MHAKGDLCCRRSGKQVDCLSCHLVNFLLLLGFTRLPSLYTRTKLLFLMVSPVHALN